jgi:hypothetical protein
MYNVTGSSRCYGDALVAVLMARSAPLRLWEVGGKDPQPDGWGGYHCEYPTILRELRLPEVTTAMRVRFSILCARTALPTGLIPMWDQWSAQLRVPMWDQWSAQLYVPTQSGQPEDVPEAVAASLVFAAHSSETHHALDAACAAMYAARAASRWEAAVASAADADYCDAVRQEDDTRQRIASKIVAAASARKRIAVAVEQEVLHWMEYRRQHAPLIPGEMDMAALARAACGLPSDWQPEQL